MAGLLFILGVGISGIAAQVLVLRELLVVFSGNELTLGVILASWILAEALGALIAGRFSVRSKNPVLFVFILQVIFSVSLPLTLYLCRVFRAFVGVPLGEGIGLPLIFLAALAVNLPLGFCHGALFSFSCRLWDTAKVYAFETIGTVFGGLALTYLLIPYFNPFYIVMVISLVNLLFFLPVLNGLSGNNSRIYCRMIVILIIGILLVNGAVDLDARSIKTQWAGMGLRDHQNSVYGNVALTDNDQQLTLFYNGLPFIVYPHPDVVFIEDFTHFTLLSCEAPERALILGGDILALASEARKHHLKQVECVEIDPVVLNMLEKYRMGSNENRQVKIINRDYRDFLKRSADKYSVILVGVPGPNDLAANRLYSREFFYLAKGKLRPGGVLSLYLPGSLSYLDPYLRDLNFSIINSLKEAYKYIRVIPGDYNIILASDVNDLENIASEEFWRRMRERGISSGVFSGGYIDYRLDKRWEERFYGYAHKATKRLNSDLAPLAVWQTLLSWNSRFSRQMDPLLSALNRLSLKWIIFGISGLILILSAYFIRNKNGLIKFGVFYSIGTSGFAGMLINMVLILSFQVAYGYLYHQIGLLISLFMSGIAIGSLLMRGWLKDIKEGLRFFIKIEFVFLAFIAFMAVFLGEGIIRFSKPFIMLAILFLSAGLLVGWEFPLAVRIFSKDQSAKAAGILYFSDLIGSYFASILAGVLFLPILGLSACLAVAILLKSSSLIFLIWGRSLKGHPFD